MLLPENSFIHLGYNRIDAVTASTLPHYLADELQQVRARATQANVGVKQKCAPVALVVARLDAEALEPKWLEPKWLRKKKKKMAK